LARADVGFEVFDFGFGAFRCGRRNAAEALFTLIAHEQPALIVNGNTDPRAELILRDREEMFDLESGHDVEGVARGGCDVGGYAGGFFGDGGSGGIGGFFGAWTSGARRTPGGAEGCGASGDTWRDRHLLTKPAIRVCVGGE